MGFVVYIGHAQPGLYTSPPPSPLSCPPAAERPTEVGWLEKEKGRGREREAWVPLWHKGKRGAGESVA